MGKKKSANKSVFAESNKPFSCILTNCCSFSFAPQEHYFGCLRHRLGFVPKFVHTNREKKSRRFLESRYHLKHEKKEDKSRRQEHGGSKGRLKRRD